MGGCNDEALIFLDGIRRIGWSKACIPFDDGGQRRLAKVYIL